jgi:hypothetical protein
MLVVLRSKKKAPAIGAINAAIQAAGLDIKLYLLLNKN